MSVTAKREASYDVEKMGGCLIGRGYTGQV